MNEIYIEWKEGLERYAQTGNKKDLVSYRELAKKYNHSPMYIMRLCKKEIAKA